MKLSPASGLATSHRRVSPIGYLCMAEFARNWTSGRLGLAVLVSGTMAAVSSAIMSTWYTSSLEDHERLQKVYREKVGTIRDVRNVTGEHVSRRPRRLSTLISPVLGSMGESYSVGTWRTIDSDPYQENKVLSSRNKHADLVSVIMTAVSLLTLLFAHDAVAGDRESGVLRLMFSNSLSRGDYLLGKVSGGLLCVVLCNAGAMTAAVLGVPLFSCIRWHQDEWLTLLALFTFGCLFSATVYLCGFFLSVVSQDSGAAMRRSLLAWVAMVFVIPSLGPHAASAMVHVLSVPEVERRVREIALTASSGEEMQGEVADLMEWYEAQIDRRRSASELIAKVSPVTSYILGVHSVTGLGDENERMFRNSLLRHSDAWNAYYDELFEGFLSRIGEYRRTKGALPLGLRDNLAMTRTGGEPLFNYERPRLEQRLAGAYGEVLVLVLLANIVLVGSAAVFMRADIA